MVSIHKVPVIVHLIIRVISSTFRFKRGAGLLICIRGSGKTRKQINENSTPHLYRMSFAYGYM